MFRALAVAVFYCVALQAHAVDQLIIDTPQSAEDPRNAYAHALLRQVLKRTEKEFGGWSLSEAATYMEPGRLLEELKIGQSINVSAQPAQPSWEQHLLAVPVPIDMGLQSWRIAMFSKTRGQPLDASTLEHLKKLRLGIGTGWASYRVFEAAGFTLVDAATYDRLFDMLTAHRFDYFLRGINEVWQEYDIRKPTHPELVVDRSFAIHAPLPWLFFVSPQTPRLAKRISKGIEAMLADGSLKTTVLQYHRGAIVRSKLCSRAIYHVKNPFLTHPDLQRKALWLDLLDPKLGFCLTPHQPQTAPQTALPH